MADRDQDDGPYGSVTSDLDLNTAGGGGKANELFKEELNRVLENILDPNTEAKAKRTITLNFEFTPDALRERVGLVVGSKVKIAPFIGTAGTVFIGRTKDGPVARTIDINQGQFDLEEEGEKKPELRAVPGTGTHS